MRTVLSTLSLVALLGVTTAAAQAKPDTTKPKRPMATTTAKPATPAPTTGSAAPAGQTKAKAKKHKGAKADSTKKPPTN